VMMKVCSAAVICSVAVKAAVPFVTILVVSSTAVVMVVLAVVLL